MRPEPSAVRPTSPVLRTAPLTFPWQTLDPFLFCAHHHEAYPRGNERLGPAASLAGRTLGEDFAGRDGWSMYHGRTVPGFPAHPHCGFETVTFVREGLVDHADSLGAAARYGDGDVQWLTAGRGIQHSETFPLLRPDAPNPLELFQLWLGLPRASRSAPPHFSMFWASRIPRHLALDGEGRRTEVTVIAGPLEDVRPLPPPPESWASRPESDVAIWRIRMAPGAVWTLPPARPGSSRVLYPFRGDGMAVSGAAVPADHLAQLVPDTSPELVAGPTEVELLLLQGAPLNERIVQHGPFVGGSPEELQRAFAEYRRTTFGGWPWPDEEPVHARREGRFALYPDGRVERPD